MAVLEHVSGSGTIFLFPARVPGIAFGQVRAHKYWRFLSCLDQVPDRFGHQRVHHKAVADGRRRGDRLAKPGDLQHGVAQGDPAVDQQVHFLVKAAPAGMPQRAVRRNRPAISRRGNADRIHAAAAAFQRNVQRHGVDAVCVDKDQHLPLCLPDLVGVQNADAIARHALKIDAALGAVKKAGARVQDRVPGRKAPRPPQYLLHRKL